MIKPTCFEELIALLLGIVLLIQAYYIFIEMLEK